MTNQESIKDKLRKLFAINERNGATEAEAVNALRLAQALLVKHGLTEEDIGPGYIEPEAKVRRMADRPVKEFEDIIARAAAELCMCRSIRHTVRSPRSKFPKIVGFTFVGLDEHIDAAETTMLYLLNQIEYLYKITVPDHLRADPVAKAHWRYSFKEGCGERVLERVREMMAQPTPDLVEVTGSTALVIQGYWDKLDQKNKEAVGKAFPNITYGHLKTYYGTGSADGYRMGDRVQLRHQVNDGANGSVQPRMITRE